MTRRLGHGFSARAIWDCASAQSCRTRTGRSSGDYQPPTRLPAKGRIEVVRYIRSNRQLALFGKRITLAETDIHQYVTAIIKVRTRKLIVVDINGEIIHHSDFNLSRELR